MYKENSGFRTNSTNASLYSVPEGDSEEIYARLNILNHQKMLCKCP
jgi:hypothetical protein